jgi:hypothetical protein
LLELRRIGPGGGVLPALPIGAGRATWRALLAFRLVPPSGDPLRRGALLELRRIAPAEACCWCCRMIPPAPPGAAAGVQAGASGR